jgi:lysophospholipase L1-like esterase
VIIGRTTAALAVCTGLLLAGCSGGSSSAGAPASPAAATPAPAPTGSLNQIYVSVGDSYAAGAQAVARGSDVTNRNGFAYQVVDAAKKKGYDLRLVNFGCGGATTTSILDKPGCPAQNLGPGAASYDPQTQVDAAEAFLRANQGRVALITVSIGGNDVTACAKAPDAVSCVTDAIKRIAVNLDTLVRRLRAATGSGTRIVGITYPDVILGEYLSPDPKKQALATQSITAFKSLLNPALKAGYASVGGSFVDVTAATGAYGPFAAVTDLPPYGKIPTPVAEVCRLTYYCEFQDIHPRTAGYAIISDLVVGTLPKR